VAYAITSTLSFDTNNGYLYKTIGTGDTGTTTVYDGTVNTDGTPKTVYNDKTSGLSAAMKNFPTNRGSNTDAQTSFLLPDDSGNVILYKYLGGTHTLIAVFASDPANPKLLSLVNVVRFNITTEGGIDPASSSPTQRPGTPPPFDHGGEIWNPGSGTGGTGGIGGIGGIGGTSGWGGTSGTGGTGGWGGATLDDIITAYYQTQLGTSLGGTGTGTGTGTAMGSNYLLKTQIVPPVCPSCPSCVGCASCGNGGKGGTSSTQSGDKTVTGELSEFGGSLNAGVKNLGNDIQGGIQNAGGDIQSGIQTAGSDIQSGVNAVGSGIKTVAQNVYGGAKDVVTGAKDVVGDIYGGVKGVAGDIYGGVKNVAEDVGNVRVGGNSRGTAGNYRGDVQSNLGWAGTGSGSVNYVTTGVSPLTYYGAVPDRESTNFLPLTADFSRFGR